MKPCRCDKSFVSQRLFTGALQADESLVPYVHHKKARLLTVRERLMAKC